MFDAARAGAQAAGRKKRASFASSAERPRGRARRAAPAGAGHGDSRAGFDVAMHDETCKTLFAFPRMVEDLLRGFVGGAWIDQLDFTTLEKLSADYVSDELRTRHGDTVWRVRHRGAWLPRAGAAGVPVHQRPGHGVAHTRVHDPAVPGVGRARRRWRWSRLATGWCVARRAASFSPAWPNPGPAPGDRPAPRRQRRWAGAVSKATTLRASRLNSTPTRWIGSPRARYLSA